MTRDRLARIAARHRGHRGYPRLAAALAALTTEDPFYDRPGFWERVNRLGNCGTCDGGGCPDCCDYVG